MVNNLGVEVTRTFSQGVPIMLATIPGTGFGFVWHGGSYIDMIREDSFGTFVIDSKSYKYGEECINVWDYGRDEPMIEFGDNEAFLNEVTEWLEA